MGRDARPRALVRCCAALVGLCSGGALATGAGAAPGPPGPPEGPTSKPTTAGAMTAPGPPGAPAPGSAAAAREPDVHGAEPPADDVDEEEVIRAPRLARETTAVSVGADQGRRIAGTQGDALKVVQNLPGVARSSFGGGQIVVWGSAPRETRVYVDGVEIPALYHGSGLRSTLASDLVKSIELVPGAYGAEYGRGLGGLVRVETRELPLEGVHGFVAADFLDASAMVTAAVGSRVRAGVAGRYSYLDHALRGAVSEDVGDSFPIPSYFDAQARAQIALRKDETLEATYLLSADSLTRTVPSADPASVRKQVTESRFHRAYLRYSAVLRDGASAAVTPFFGRDESREEASFGEVPLRLSAAAWKYGVRASYRARLLPRTTFALGADVLGAVTAVERTGTLSLPAREGDVAVFGQAPADEVAADAWSAHVLDVGPYVTAEIDLGPFVLTPGLRFDAYLLEGSRRTPRIGATPPIGLTRVETAIAPRLSATWRPSPRFSMSAAGGLYHQPPEAEELSASFGTPALALSRGVHASLGPSVQITDALSLSGTLFYKSLDRLVVRSRLSTPKLAQALVQDGEGRSFGAQVLLRQEAWRGLSGWVSYSIGRSERRYRGDAAWRLFDHDQPHVLAVVASKELFGFTASARVRYTSGAPRTPVVGSFYDAQSDRYQPVFGAQNTTRLPEFFQLDLRVERAFSLRPVTIHAYLDVLNVTHQQNAEEVVYSHDFSKKGFITGLPILAVAGVRLEM